MQFGFVELSSLHNPFYRLELARLQFLPQVSQRMLGENETQELSNVPGDIFVREDFTGVPAARSNFVWRKSCCFHNAEALDIVCL